MNNRKKHVDPIPDEFASYEEAAAFWDTHDTTDYPEAFQTVEVQGELRQRHYEVEIDEDLIYDYTSFLDTRASLRIVHPQKNVFLSVVIVSLAPLASDGLFW